MIIYRCCITNDEMFSDTFKVKETEIFFEVEGALVIRNADVIDDSKIGGNASAEEPTESDLASSVSGVNIILNHNLSETFFEKKAYMTYLKEYMKALKAYLEENHPERVAKFQEEAPAAVKAAISDFKNLQFYTGESMNPDGMVALLNYREDGTTPYMLFFKDGLVQEKC